MSIEIPLTQGLVALVDEADAEAVTQHKWYAAREYKTTFYALRKIRRPDGTYVGLRLHGFLTGWPLVDHINRDGLDNRRANLRPATTAENSRNALRLPSNTSGFKGVTWHKQARKWQAQIGVDGRRRHLGLHACLEAAAEAYDDAAREFHGEFARLNFPINGERSAL